MNADFEKLRREYLYDSLNEKDLDPDPIKQFEAWFDQAINAGIDLPNAMALATASKTGEPTVRFVLMKEFSGKGFVFFSHSDSPKGKQLAENPRASTVFYWSALDRQVRITGDINLVTHQEADEYFNSRPYESRLSAWVAPQSNVVGNRVVLEQRFRELKQEYPKDVPRPQDWVGYRLQPVKIEFWQGRENRLHDRVLYFYDGNNWTIQRLAP